MTKKQTKTMNNFIRQLEITKSHIDKTISKVKSTTNERLILIKELIDECKIFDESYKEYCDDVDEIEKLEPGTTYNRDSELKYFTEADLWHRISLILRRLEEIDKT